MVTFKQIINAYSSYGYILLIYHIEEPLLSKDGLRKRSFDLFSSMSVIGHGPECALCSSEEDGYWSPNIKEENPYWGVSFAQNIFMKSIEVRGVFIIIMGVLCSYNKLL